MPDPFLLQNSYLLFDSQTLQGGGRLENSRIAGEFRGNGQSKMVLGDFTFVRPKRYNLMDLTRGLNYGLTSTLTSFLRYCMKFLKDIFTEING